MLPARARLLPAIFLVAAATIIAGCGKSGSQTVAGGGPLRHLAPVEAEGTVSVTTRNTNRVGGADVIVDAGSVARVVYPGLTTGSRPQAVVLVDQRNWAASLAASVLAGAPLGAPILYAVGKVMPREPSGARSDASAGGRRAGRHPGDPDRHRSAGAGPLCGARDRRLDPGRHGGRDRAVARDGPRRGAPSGDRPAQRGAQGDGNAGRRARGGERGTDLLRRRPTRRTDVGRRAQGDGPALDLCPEPE